MTIRELSAYCDISPSTLSRYFNGTAGISPKLREKIEKAVAETGYQPTFVYRRAHQPGSGMICAVLPRWQHVFSRELMEYLQPAAEKAGCSLSAIVNNPNDPVATAAQISQLSPDHVALLFEGNSPAVYKLLIDRRIPTCICTAPSPNRSFLEVRIDDIAAAYEATNYLIGLGHRNIGLITDKAELISSGFQRLAGSRKAMYDAGISFTDRNIVYAGSSFDDGWNGMNELLKRNLGITAVFVFSDTMACGAIASLTDHGIHVPGDISVMGFDDIQIAEQCRPKLTTVHQPLEQMAKECVNQLLAGGKGTSVILRHSIHIRESCRKL